MASCTRLKSFSPLSPVNGDSHDTHVPDVEHSDLEMGLSGTLNLTEEERQRKESTSSDDQTSDEILPSLQVKIADLGNACWIVSHHHTCYHTTITTITLSSSSSSTAPSLH